MVLANVSLLMMADTDVAAHTDTMKFKLHDMGPFVNVNICGGFGGFGGNVVARYRLKKESYFKSKCVGL